MLFSRPRRRLSESNYNIIILVLVVVVVVLMPGARETRPFFIGNFNLLRLR